MATRFVDRDAIGHDEDWQGNNAAFTCPACKKVYIVSARMHAEVGLPYSGVRPIARTGRWREGFRRDR